MTASPEAQYWLERNGEVRGPYDFEILVTMWQRNELHLTDRLCKNGHEHWIEVAAVMKSFDRAAHSSPSVRSNPNRSMFGLILIVLSGLVTAYFFFGYDTTVRTERRYIPSVGYVGGERVHNQGLLQNRLLGCIGGSLGLAIGVAIMLASRKKT